VEAKCAKCRSTRLSLGLNRSSDDLVPDASTSLGGGTSAASAAEGEAFKVGGATDLGSARVPQGRLLGPIVFLAERQVSGRRRSVGTTVISIGSYSSSPFASPSWPDDEGTTVGATRLG
jgi:hypothetical protein